MPYPDTDAPYHNRAFLMEKRQALGSESAYLNWVWETREAERCGSVPGDHLRTASRGGWPYNSETALSVVVKLQTGG